MEVIPGVSVEPGSAVEVELSIQEVLGENFSAQRKAGRIPSEHVQRHKRDAVDPTCAVGVLVCNSVGLFGSLSDMIFAVVKAMKKNICLAGKNGITNFLEKCTLPL
ncbi:hypothetical protein CEXT_196731 [Caerostris extrusa]|uniref:Uncharacterized protein n=1 Tax=Caerostris extrusa TaxID=172846 RepID=A0AAV4MVQ3_CAEEX|nr:hypothetical protein CEXT_196731 [Caerostris extrusa]